ncbi:MAG: sugar ABC transporter permease [Chloroflexota bacterium]|nr:sugar ABC transporter permease [Chloroflexota bacterium]MDE2948553.1 sugar ABC transporter permease [Chloroflexota bacterium]
MPATIMPKNEPVSARRRRLSKLSPYLWILPALAVYGVFKLYPLVSGLQMSLLRWDGIEEPRYIGLRNFEKILSDPMTGAVLMNNVHYAVGTVLGKIVLSLFLAILLHQALKGRTFYRTSLFMPVVMSFVVVGVLWSWLFNPQFGLINSLLRGLGLGVLVQDWLGDAAVALNSLILVDIWKWYGFHMVIFLAGLQSIPDELYEAARIDGASVWQQFLHVTLPMLQPVMIVNVTISVMGAFNVFDIPFIMTAGGPANATNVMALHIYIRGFKFYRFGFSAALSYVLLVIVTLVAAIQLKLMTSGDNTD